MKISSEKDLLAAIQTEVVNGMASDLEACMEGEPLTTDVLAECVIDRLYTDFAEDFEVTPKMVKRVEKSLEYYV